MKKLHISMAGKRAVNGYLFILPWLLGFLLYRYLMTVDLPIGCTLPDVVLVMVLTALVQKKRRA